MNEEELLSKFAESCEEIEARLKTPGCKMGVCQEIWNDLQDEKGLLGVFAGVCDIFANKGDDAAVNEAGEKYANMHCKLASKIASLGDKDTALSVIEAGLLFLSDQESSVGKEMDALKTAITTAATPVPQPTLKPVPTPQPEPKPVPQPTPQLEPDSKPMNKNIIIAGVAALVIAAGGFFTFSGPKKTDSEPKIPAPVATKQVKLFNVHFDVPQGTKVELDGTLIATNGAQIAEGKHSMKLSHPLLELKYSTSQEILNDGKISPVKDIAFKDEANETLKQAYMACFTDILKSACANETNPQFDANKFRSDANNDPKIKGTISYFARRSSKSLNVVGCTVGKPKLSTGDAKIPYKLTINGTVDVEGQTAKGNEAFTLDVDVVYEVKGDMLLMAGIENGKVTPRRK